MKVLVVGKGGQTHALARALASSPGTREMYVAPGNDGMIQTASLLALESDDATGIAAWASAASVDLVVCADPAGLAADLAGALEAVREGSERRQPHAVCATAPATARLSDTAWVAEQMRVRRVVLAAEADATADTIVTLMALTDGVTVRGLGLALVYRRLHNGGGGPVTEGMGAEAPPAQVPPALTAWLEQAVLRPLVEALAEENTPYRGFLYVEALVEPKEGGAPRVIGVYPGLSPTASQAILPLLKTDLLLLLMDVAEGTLDRDEIVLSGEAACAVTLISEGYPDMMAYETGYGILGLEASPPRTVSVFHEATRDPYKMSGALITPRDKDRAGGLRASSGIFGMFSFGRGRKDRADTQARRGLGDPFSHLVTAGGRVVTIVARATTMEEARDQAYDAVSAITFTGRIFRTDIGQTARERSVARGPVSKR